MFSKIDKYITLFNGAIYNYFIQKRARKNGYEFYTNSDTKLYGQVKNFGERILRINLMEILWAFVIFDTFVK